MTVAAASSAARAQPSSLALPATFSEWRHEVRMHGSLPVIAVAGTRGKTTVIRLLDAIFAEAGLQTATWTDSGIEIRRRKQKGELVPWKRALARIHEGIIDVGIHELDWVTVQTVGLPTGVYPLVTVTNICSNSDACLITEEARRALRTYPAVLKSVHRNGMLVLNGEDYAVSGVEHDLTVPTIVTGSNRDVPAVRHHLVGGKPATWSDAGVVYVGTEAESAPVAHFSELAVCYGGSAAFEATNVMLAVATARACGISPAQIAQGLSAFVPDVETLGGSFSRLTVRGATVLIDRPSSPWFLKPVLRAVRAIGLKGRVLVVAGLLPTVPDEDLTEVGRLLGRTASTVILHGERANPERAAMIRHGVALNDFPPVLVHTPAEKRALQRLVDQLHSTDTVLVLTDQPVATARMLEKLASHEKFDDEAADAR